MKPVVSLLLKYFIRRLVVLAFLALLIPSLFFFTKPYIVSPSHPYVDENNNGIDDFEEGSGQYTDPEIRAQLYGVSFPIPELGNCEDYSACRTYCEDPVNYNTCIDYAKKRGFYKDEDNNVKKEEILEKAKKQLGCDSYESCKNFCSKTENFDKCASFAKSNNLAGGHVDNPEEKRILEKAKEILGCNTPSSCMSFCEKEENREKCSEFAKEAGLRGGEVRVGPGGCTSEESCKTFCSDPANFQICQGFTKSHGGQFRGPGGCNSEDSCRSFCEKNPEDCGFDNREDVGEYRGRPYPSYNPQEMCYRTPSCTWSDNTCKCGIYDNPEEAKRRSEEYARFCRENPEKCNIGGEGNFENKEEREKFEKYCRENPDNCGGKNNYIEYNPEASCKSAGCSWNGNSCDCSNVTTGPMVECTRKQGCSWINSSCQCNSTSTYNYPIPSNTGSSSSYANCPSGQYWNGQYCTSSSYSGGSPSSNSGNSSNREQQETACRAGGGSCEWNNGVCNCRGYSSNSTSTTTQSSGTSGSSGSGMSREQQESGCRSCGGTCSWNGDMCNCQCGSQTQTQTTSQPQPTQESQPQQQTQTQPQQESQPQQTQTQPAETQSSPGIQGISINEQVPSSGSKGIVQLVWEWVLGFIK